MNVWGISLVVCCLVADIFVGEHVYGQHRPIYTLSTNHTDLIIQWQNHAVVHGVTSNMEVAVSPDGKSVAWTITRQHGIRLINSSEDPVCEATLFTAYAGKKPIMIPDTRSSRGFDIPMGNFQHEDASWDPCQLQWDSTSRYLYFSTQPWVTAALLWQLKPGERMPRIVDHGGDHWLIKHWFGPDDVLIQGLRYERYDPDEKTYSKDYENCYLYTAENIATPQYAQSEKRVRPPVKDWGK